MTTYSSEPVTLSNVSVQQVYDRMSHPENANAAISNLSDEMKEKVKNVEFFEDGIAITAAPVGVIKLMIAERNEPESITYKAQNSPIPFEVLIKSQALSDTDSIVSVDFNIELNPFLKPMVEKPLKEGINKIGDLIKLMFNK